MKFDSKTVGILLVIVGIVLLVGQCGDDGVVIDPEAPQALLCLRELGGGSIDDTDEAWKCIETIDEAAKAEPKLPHFLWLFKNARDSRNELHGGVKAYADLGKPLPYVWHLGLDRSGEAVIINEGPLRASVVLGWVGLSPRAPPQQAQAANVEQWLDVDFSLEPPGRLGLLSEPELMHGLSDVRIRNIREAADFAPIPRSEWPKWCDRFPPERLVWAVEHQTGPQTMGSCVGHSGVNGVEGPSRLMFGLRYFSWLSAMSLYGDPRDGNDNGWGGCGSSPGSGAYIGDCASIIGDHGVLPGTPDETRNTQRFSHTHPVRDDFYASKPVDCAPTAAQFRGEVYRVDDEGSWFAVTMRDGLRVHLGRSSHAISGFMVVRSGGGYVFAYENSWGKDWGDYNKSIGYDSRAYSGYVYVPCVRDEIQIPIRRTR